MTEKGWPRAGEPCGSTPRQHGRISDDGEAVEAQLWHVGQRRDEGKSSGAQELLGVK